MFLRVPDPMPHVLSDPRSADDERDMIDRAVRALGEGKLVAFPTETVYGIAADASQEAAVARLLQIKGRRPGQPLTLAVKSVAAAFDYCPGCVPGGPASGTALLAWTLDAGAQRQPSGGAAGAARAASSASGRACGFCRAARPRSSLSAGDAAAVAGLP